MKSKVTLIILIVIIVILGGTTIFLGYKYSQKSDEVVTLSSELETTQGELEEYKDTTTTEAGEVIEVETERIVEKLSIVDFDESKLTIDNSNYTFSANSYDDRLGIYITVYSNLVRIQVSDNAIKTLGKSDTLTSFDYEISNVDQKIVKVCFTGTLEYKAFFLMEDGTVRYLTTDDMLSKSTTLKNVDGLSDVVDIRKAVFGLKNGGGNVLCIALMSDGTSKALI